MDALALLARYQDSDADFYDLAETVPLAHVVPQDWKEAVVDPDTGMIERIPYELCVLVALRKALRRREIWVEGANIWRNPEDDLPPDFEENRDVHYGALSKLPATRRRSSPTSNNATPTRAEQAEHGPEEGGDHRAGCGSRRARASRGSASRPLRPNSQSRPTSRRSRKKSPAAGAS